MSQRNRKRIFLKMISTSLAIALIFLSGCSTPNTFSNPSGKNVSSSGTKVLDNSNETTINPILGDESDEGDDNPFLIDQSDKRLFGVDPPKGGPYLYCNGSCIVTPMRPPACYLSWFIKLEKNAKKNSNSISSSISGFRPMSSTCEDLTSIYEKKVYRSKKNYRQIAQ